MKILIKGSKVKITDKILRIVLHRINRRYAHKNLAVYPQLVIHSFDSTGLYININGRYENSQLQLVEEFIRQKLPNAKDQIVLDVGANIGNHSVFFSKFFKKVYSFEPNPITYEVLKINSKYVTEFKNIEPLNFGLSNYCWDFTFFCKSLKFWWIFYCFL